MITFKPASDYPKGTIAGLLRASYGVNKDDSDLDWDRIAKVFDEFDDEVHADERVARCTFISVVDNEPIGLGSLDPRKKPEYGDIGHNCIIPGKQGKGYGQAQLQEILKRLREKGIQTARVSTGLDDFSEPARRMYESAGFVKTRTFKSDTYPFGEMVEYELSLMEG